jgi:hypothetical protein
MSITARRTTSLTINSPLTSIRTTREGSGNVGRSIAVPAGYAGTISSGTVTATGHNISTGNKVAVFWYDATTGAPKRRYGITAGTVAGDAVPIGSGGGTGDTLPASGAVVICKATVDTGLSLTGSAMNTFHCQLSRRGCVDIQDSGNSTLKLVDALDAGEGYSWMEGDGTAPFSAAVAGLHCYNGSTTAMTVTAAAVLA